VNAPAAIPHWPALLRRDKAIAYVDLTSAKFEAAMVAGEIPCPILVGGQERWSRAQIDEYLERLTGGVDRDWLSKTPLARGARP
jgi:hypothetical protein